MIADLDRVDFIGAFDVEHSDNKVMGTESDLVAWLVDHPDYIEKGFMVLEREYDTAVGG